MSRGQGRLFRPTWNGRTSAVWWLDYAARGARHRESSGTTSRRDAARILRDRLGDRETGKLVGRPDRVVLASYTTAAGGAQQLAGGLRWLHETQYELDGLRSKARIMQCWHHLERLLGADCPALDVTPTRLDAYAKTRLAEGAARATLNNELAALRRAFNLARRKGLIGAAPVIELAAADNVREGFFEEDDFAAVLLELPAYARPVIRFLRVTGWRVSEALALSWDRVDWEAEGIRLAARQTKGKRARLFPFGLAPDLKSVLEAAWAARDGVCVFQGPRRGAPLGYTTLLHHWQAATKRAGCPGRLMHDLRRTAARDFRRAGVDEGTIMVLCGWRRREMFDRYNIIDEQDLAAAVAKRFGNGKRTASEAASPADPARLSSGAT
jgi:integrase